ncbi:MAG: lytic murein transglycosylase B [Pseudomonadales bacterium]|nr:lytic murein transglycosylase B [Pseudomonadales bacterium]
MSGVMMSLTGLTACAAPEPYLGRDDVEAFIAEVSADGKVERATLEAAFKQAVYQQKIVDAISRPAEKVLTWKEYQDIFLTEKRVTEGQQFMTEHAATLAKAEQTYGVPAEIVAAIIGVETFYGRIKGGYRVIDALSTLAFDYPPRSKFFRSELAQFFLLAAEEQRDPTEPVGSYAGAMGYGQFIPSSYRHYAVDFDRDGKRDIWENPVDAIGSVANYLAEHGWQRDDDITAAVTLKGAAPANLFTADLRPTATIGDLATLTENPLSGWQQNTPVAPMILNGKQGEEYWLGFNNFYVITRYNHSRLYAMAVYQLSEQLKERQLANQ